MIDILKTNITLARLAELSQLEKSRRNSGATHDSNPDNPSSPDDIATAGVSLPGGSFFSRIASWFRKESSSVTLVPTLNSRSQEEIINYCIDNKVSFEKAYAAIIDEKLNLIEDELADLRKDMEFEIEELQSRQ